MPYIGYFSLVLGSFLDKYFDNYNNNMFEMISRVTDYSWPRFLLSNQTQFKNEKGIFFKYRTTIKLVRFCNRRVSTKR